MNVIIGCGGFACEVGRAFVETRQEQSLDALIGERSVSYWSEQSADATPNGAPLRKPTREDLVHVAIGDNRARQRIMTTPPFELLAWFPIIDSRAVVGRGVIVNYNCSVGHDVHVHDFAQLGPLANLCGRAEVDTGAFIGASAVVLPGVFVGAWAVVGAGAVVTKDVPEGETWAGNPARRIK